MEEKRPQSSTAEDVEWVEHHQVADNAAIAGCDSGP
jgi:hypothetical protein